MIKGNYIQKSEKSSHTGKNQILKFLATTLSCKNNCSEKLNMKVTLDACKYFEKFFEMEMLLLEQCVEPDFNSGQEIMHKDIGT